MRDRHDEAERQKLTRMQDMARRVQPRSNADFAVLYNELDTWRKAEVAKIKVRICRNSFSFCLTGCSD